MIKALDTFIDRITMYRLMVYYLIAILVSAVGLSLFGVITYAAPEIVLSAALLVGVSWLSEKLFHWLFKSPANTESSLITALILALLIRPELSGENLLFLAVAAFLAVASKYVLTTQHTHVFNPAAIAVVLTSIFAHQSASWWVGTTWLAPVVIVGGLMVARKIRHVQMVFAFLLTAIMVTTVMASMAGSDVPATLERIILHSSLLFLGFAMLTEPLTAPARHRQQLIFAVLVGVLFSPKFHLGSFYASPEMALILGNLFAYVVTPRYRRILSLKEKVQTGPQTAEYIFSLKTPIEYKPGQYMEFTMPVNKSDNRGNRRTFTIASSPTEDTLRIGVKFYPKGSTFKKALFKMEDGKQLAVAQLAGDFTMPTDTSKKLAFIAGGIGVTPFRSMIKYITDTSEKRDIHVLYAENTPESFVYKDILEASDAVVTYVSAEAPQFWKGETGHISADLIKKHVPDFTQRLFYVSGPHPMVQATVGALHDIGVHARNIKTDHFSGYA